VQGGEGGRSIICPTISAGRMAPGGGEKVIPAPTLVPGQGKEEKKNDCYLSIQLGGGGEDSREEVISKKGPLSSLSGKKGKGEKKKRMPRASRRAVRRGANRSKKRRRASRPRRWQKEEKSRGRSAAAVIWSERSRLEEKRGEIRPAWASTLLPVPGIALSRWERGGGRKGGGRREGYLYIYRGGVVALTKRLTGEKSRRGPPPRPAQKKKKKKGKKKKAPRWSPTFRRRNIIRKGKKG